MAIKSSFIPSCIPKWFFIESSSHLFSEWPATYIVVSVRIIETQPKFWDTIVSCYRG